MLIGKQLAIATVTMACLLFCLPVEAQQAPKAPARETKGAIKLPAAAGPSQVVLFNIKVKEASKSEVETFFRKELLPYAVKSDKIARIRTYAKLIGSDFTYVVLVEVKPGVPLTFGSLIEILSDGRTAEQTSSTINRLAAFFKESSSSVILYRPDLSVSRDGFGYITFAERKQ
jgi:hypothetical protein